MASQTLSAAAAGTFTLGGDLRVNRLGFGAMRITGDGIWGPPKDKAAALAVLRRAVELDVNLIDTADSYGPNVSEELIAEALYPYSDGLVIATKGGHERTGPNVWVPNGRPDHLRKALEGSLRILKLDCIDLYQLHRVDPKVPFRESVGALADLQREGKIRHVGLSNFNVEKIGQAREIVPIVSVQNRFNNASGGDNERNGVKDDETIAVVEYCTREGIAFFPWGGRTFVRTSRRRREGEGRKGEPNRAGLALTSLAGHHPDSRHVVRRPSRRERRRWRDRIDENGVRDVIGRRRFVVRRSLGVADASVNTRRSHR
jgi:pyridoxine 4-dehydrogenase